MDLKKRPLSSPECEWSLKHLACADNCSIITYLIGRGKNFTGVNSNIIKYAMLIVHKQTV